jgi:hypothetical protein
MRPRAWGRPCQSTTVGKRFLATDVDIKKCIDMAKAGDADFAKLVPVRLQAKVRLIEAIRDALGEAEAYVGGKCAVECVRDALRKEAEHLDEVGWYTRAQYFFDAADTLDALNKDDAP